MHIDRVEQIEMVEWVRGIRWIPVLWKACAYCAFYECCEVFILKGLCVDHLMCCPLHTQGSWWTLFPCQSSVDSPLLVRQLIQHRVFIVFSLSWSLSLQLPSLLPLDKYM